MSLEMGKIRTEGVGEVQEFVDIVSYDRACYRVMSDGKLVVRLRSWVI